MQRLWLAVACTLVHIPSIVMRYAPFRDILDKKQKHLLVILYILVLAAVACLYYFLPLEHVILSHKLILILVAAALSWVNIRVMPDRWREQLFATGLASVQVSVAFYACAYVSIRVLRLDDSVELVTASALMTFTLFLLLRGPYCNNTRRTITPFLGMDCGEYWKRIWYIPIVLFLACFFSAPMDSYSGSTGLLICRLFMLFTSVVMCTAISEDHGHMRRRLAMAEQLNLQREYYGGLAERVAEARKSRHDFKHHMAAIHKYIDTDDKEGLRGYCESLQEAIVSTVEVPYTGNVALDGVLYRYAALAGQHGIRFEFSGTVGKPDMPDTDLCALLGNALENALTGSLTIPEGRFISVKMRLDHAQQIILVRNAFDGVVEKEGEQFLSRKRDNAPGIGLNAMQSICDKYGAVMNLHYDEETFAVLLIIRTKEAADR